MPKGIHVIYEYKGIHNVTGIFVHKSTECILEY